MKLLLIGYGKMGKTIEPIALKRGHCIAYKIDQANSALLSSISREEVEVAIEFSQPAAAYQNIYRCIAQNIPVISGTTGWLARKKELVQYCREKDGTFFYAPNFSIGVNIFFKVNALLAQIMDAFPNYTPQLEETHHTEKKDAPSGTAIALAEAMIKNSSRKKSWINTVSQQDDTLSIISKRASDVPGTHTVTYTSSTDSLEIKHIAHSREGFALGAVLVAEWIQGKKGVLTMEDFLNKRFQGE